ncbi:tyrosine--tRNA ligase [Nonomuraea diastatica]|uniref:Tyrosine--tRNA ligase n=1 Tax=Nonomuraea diastatica TaxID=1848329 RepID=A0A4R4W8N0_9ACTN|nr:tyrosine--tRNA ligase [Nonomuraea diastatica]TDD15098.1 tyrosine--tRNA ligase [Nonomuraea diastatica]
MNLQRATDEADNILQGAEFTEKSFARTMRRELVERLAEYHRTKVPLRVFAGYDASRPNLHLGHTITMRKLRLFQELGHDVIFLVGTVTAQIGDPSDRLYERPRIPLDEVVSAASTFVKQMSLVLDPDRTTIMYNGDWLSDLPLSDILAVASAFTVQQVTSPAAVKDRIKSSKPVGLHELLYPLMQGYDALHLRADVQLGTVGPIFNILAGRRLQRIHGQRPCIGITYPTLWGTRGHRRMSKREGTHIALAEEPNEQFAKVMSIDDETMRQWITLVSSWSPDEARERLQRWGSGELHPMALKQDLAFDIVRTYHGEAAAAKAKESFLSGHRGRRDPDPSVAVPLIADSGGILDVLHATGSVPSRQQARRLLLSGAVRVNGDKVFEEGYRVSSGDLISVGPRRLYVLQPDETPP